MAEKVYFVYHKKGTEMSLINITESEVNAQHSAERFVLENAPLECEVLELAAVSRTKYPTENIRGQI